MKKAPLLLFILFSVITLQIKSQYKDLLNFNGTNGSSPQGTNLIIYGNRMFGMTEYGGAHGEGCIFGLNTDGSGYKDLYDFNGTNGAYPNSSLSFSANDSVLYGTAPLGGKYNDGSLFSIHTDGTGFTKLLDFNDANGRSPIGSLILYGNILYGVTQAGGVNNDGVLFSIRTNGSGYSDLLDFDGTIGQQAPSGIIRSGSVFYGTFNYGGSSGNGCVFTINMDGTGYKDLLDFSGSNGANPFGTVVLGDSTLYGMTFNGGAYTYGSIFSVNTKGGGYFDLHDFNLADGMQPYGTLTLSGNTLYGLASAGGSSYIHNSFNGYGCIFSVKTDGTGYTDIYNFNGTTGFSPNGSITLFGSSLYGMTSASGKTGSGAGLVFRYNDFPMASFFLSDSSACSGNCAFLGDSSLNAANSTWKYNGKDTVFSAGKICTSGKDSFSLALIVSNPFGSDTLTKNIVLNCISTGIEKLNSAQGFSLSPNPNTGEALLSYELLSAGNSHFEIYDLLGKKLAEVLPGFQSVGKYSVNLFMNQWKSGIYVLKGCINNRVFSERLVISSK